MRAAPLHGRGDGESSRRERRLLWLVVLLLLLTLIWKSRLSLTTAGVRPAADRFLRLGTHVIVELRQAPFEVLNSTSLARDALLAATSAGSLTVVGEHFQSFPVMGLSGVLLISESHLSIHTWPEHHFAAIDIFVCGHLGLSQP